MATTDDARAWGQSLRFWTRVSLVYLIAITVTGAVVRLTGSGLGCTDWPTCQTNTELEAPTFHAAIEFGNRMVSGLAIVPVLGAALAARRGDRRDLRPWFIGLIAGFAGQVVLGMLVTRTELDPRVVLGHFLLSIVLVWLAVVLDHRIDRPRPPAPKPADPFRGLGRTTLGLAAVTIVVGTLVTGSGPHTGSNEGEPVPRLGFDITGITRIHSITAWLLVSSVLIGLLYARRRPGPARTWLQIIAVGGVVQGTIGYVQFATGVPVVLVGFHIAGSVLLWTAVSYFHLHAEDGFAVEASSPRGGATMVAAQ